MLSIGNGTQKQQTGFTRRICQRSKLFYLLLYVSATQGKEGLQPARSPRLRSANSFGWSGSQIPNAQTYGPKSRGKRQDPIQRGGNVQSGAYSGYQSSSYNNEQALGSSSAATSSCLECPPNYQQTSQSNYNDQQAQQWNSPPAASTYQQQIQDSNFYQQENQINQPQSVQQQSYYNQQNAPTNQQQRITVDETGIGWLPNFKGDKYTDPGRIAETRALNERFYQSIGGEPSYPGNVQPIN